MSRTKWAKMSQMGLQLFLNYLYHIVWKKAHNQNCRKLPKMEVNVIGLFWPTTLSELLEKGNVYQIWRTSVKRCGFQSADTYIYVHIHCYLYVCIQFINVCIHWFSKTLKTCSGNQDRCSSHGFGSGYYIW